MSAPGVEPGLSPEGLDLLSAAVDAIRTVGHLPSAEGEGERTFGRFRLREVLGQGKFGIVFRAEDPQAGRVVALKLPQPAALLDPLLAERFRREIDAAGALDHPGIVPVLETGAVGPVAYIAMPYIPGPTLARWLKDNAPLTAPVAVDLSIALADAVQYAHDRGVLHCDLKPANVLLSEAGDSAAIEEGRRPVAGFFPRITDFGLARLLHRDPLETCTHLTAGTPPYMAPEQALGARRDLTARCDIHALAAILYELLTGRVPYEAATDTEQLRQLIEPHRTPTRPRSLCQAIPRDLEAIVLKGLEKAPEARYGSVRDWADDLRRFRQGRPTRARPVGPWGRVVRWARHRPVVASLFATCLAMALLAAWLAGRMLRQEAHLRHELALAEQEADLHEFHATLERVRHRRGEQLGHWADANLADLRELAAHSSANRARAALCSEAAGALAAPRLRLVRELAAGKNAFACAFSPDGRTVALGERYPVLPSNELRVWLSEVATGKVRGELRYPVDLAWEKRHGNTRADGARSLCYSPDGRWLVLGTRGGRLVRWDLNKPAPRAIAWAAQPGEKDHRRDEVRALLFSEDGAVLVSGSMGRQLSRWSVRDNWALAERRSGMIPIGTPKARHFTWAWEEDEKTRWFVQWDLRTGARAHRRQAPVLRCFSATAGGEVLVGSSQQQGIDCWSIQPEYPDRRRPLLRSSFARQDENINALAFTPDGRYLFASTQSRFLELWDATGTSLIARAPLAGGSSRLAVSPRGDRVAVCEQQRALLFEIDSSPVRRTAVVEAGEVGTFAVTENGQRLATYLLGAIPRSAGDEHWLSSLTLYARGARGLAPRQTWRVPTRGVPDRHLGLSLHGKLRLAFQAMQGDGPVLRSLSGQAVPAGRLNDLLHHDGHWWAAEGPNLIRWDAESGEKQAVYSAGPMAERDGLELTVLAAGPAGLFAGRRDGQVLRFDRQGQERGAWSLFRDQEVTSLALRGDGREALVGGSLGAIVRLALPTGEVSYLPAAAHRTPVRGTAYLPDGTILTASGDQTVRFWDNRDRLLLTLREGGPIAQLAQARGGSELYLRVRGEWGVRVWDLQQLHERLVQLGLSPGWSAPRSSPCHTVPTPTRGLVSEWYDDPSFEWRLHRRIDPQITLDATGQPSPWLTSAAWSVRWSGLLQAPRAGRMELHLDADGPATLWLDGRRVFDRAAKETVELPATPVSFRLDYVKGKTGRCRLLWRPAGSARPFVAVPPEAFVLERSRP